MPRSLPSKSRQQLPADKDMQAACPSKRVATRSSLGMRTPADADQLPNGHAADRVDKDCNQEDEAPETADRGELVGRPRTRARKLEEPQRQPKSDHQQKKRRKIENSGSSSSRKPLTWNTWFELLVEYKEDNQHTRVPQNYVDASTGSRLGNWVDRQRCSYARDQLSDERRQRLDSIGFEWKIREQSDSKPWDTWFQLLVTFKEDNQHTRVARDYVDASTGSKLGRWVDTQRNFYGRGQLSDERRNRLESIGFEWKIRERHKSETWYTRFQQLVEYKEDHQHTRVPYNYVDASTGSKLGEWVYTQRRSYAREQLSDERRRCLEGIGFEWKARESYESELWDTWFQLLIEYKEDHQHTRVPKSYVDASTGSKLGRWVREQRRSYTREQLSDERIHRLESIGFEWKAAPPSWDTWFELLVTFKEEHEHTRVPKVYVDAFTGWKLGNWVSTQRRSYAREQLSDERIHRLESIGFEWKAVPSWGTWFELLVQYKEEHEHTRVPQDYVDASTGSKLGSWVHNQRQQRKQLSDDRRQRLDSIGFEWSPRQRGGLKKRISLNCGIRRAQEVDTSELDVMLAEGRPWRCVSGEDESGAVGVISGTVVSVPLDDD